MAKHCLPDMAPRLERDLCPRCDSGELTECTASTVVWRGGLPYLIEAIPALSCSACGEVFIDDRTAERLNRLCRNVLEVAPVDRTIEVPVVSFAALSPQAVETDPG